MYRQAFGMWLGIAERVSIFSSLVDEDSIGWEVRLLFIDHLDGEYIFEAVCYNERLKRPPLVTPQ